jgi:N-dimethylarginine dimethylaminohydrolase
VGFVIDDKIIVSNIIPDRQEEIDAYGSIYRQIHYKDIYNLPETVHVEGGDVVLQIDSETIARASAKGSSMATRRGVLSPQASFI